MSCCGPCAVCVVGAETTVRQRVDINGSLLSLSAESSCHNASAITTSAASDEHRRSGLMKPSTPWLQVTQAISFSRFHPRSENPREIVLTGIVRFFGVHTMRIRYSVESLSSKRRTRPDGERSVPHEACCCVSPR